MEFVGVVGGDVDDASGLDWLGFVVDGDLGFAGDDVIDFVFGVWILGVGASGCEGVEATAEGVYFEEF